MIGFHVDKIETVIFDIGGVLLNIDHDAFPRLLGIERSRVNHVDKQAIERIAREYEIGRIGTEEFFGMMDEIFKGKYTRGKLENAWNAIVVEKNSRDHSDRRCDSGTVSNGNSEQHESHPFPGIVRYCGNRQKIFQIISLFSNWSCQAGSGGVSVCYSRFIGRTIFPSFHR